MDFSSILVQTAFILLAAFAVGGLVAAIFLPHLTGQADITKRVGVISGEAGAKRSVFAVVFLMGKM